VAIPDSIDEAYAAIKNLENSGVLTLPEPQGTVLVGPFIGCPTALAVCGATTGMRPPTR
jgi:hypothetical protein